MREEDERKQREFRERMEERIRKSREARAKMFSAFFNFQLFAQLFLDRARFNLKLSRSLEDLGLGEVSSNTVTREQVMKAFREKAMLTHPDRGGSQESFMAVQDAKDFCLAYIDSREASNTSN